THIDIRAATGHTNLRQRSREPLQRNSMEILSDFQRTPCAFESIVRTGVSKQTSTLEAGSSLLHDYPVARSNSPHLSASANGYPSGYFSARKSEGGRLMTTFPLFFYVARQSYY